MPTIRFSRSASRQLVGAVKHASLAKFEVVRKFLKAEFYTTTSDRTSPR